MARIAKKKSVDNNIGLLNVVDGVDKKNVVSITDFGSFFIILLKDGAIYHTHIGYEVRCKRWCTDMNNETQETTLFNWLSNLVDFKKAVRGNEQVEFPGTGQTNEQMLDYMKILTEANMLHPVTAFSDLDTATKFASDRINFLREKAEELDKATSSSVQEESEEDMRKNYENGQQAVIAEDTASVLADDKNSK